MHAIACPSCQTLVEIDGAERNTEWECPMCGMRFMIQGVTAVALDDVVAKAPSSRVGDGSRSSIGCLDAVFGFVFGGAVGLGFGLVIAPVIITEKANPHNIVPGLLQAFTVFASTVLGAVFGLGLGLWKWLYEAGKK